MHRSVLMDPGDMAALAYPDMAYPDDFVTVRRDENQLDIYLLRAGFVAGVRAARAERLGRV